MTELQNPSDEYRISKSRLEALIDGIFAFAMTLLVTGLVVPQVVLSEAAAVVPARLAAMRPEFFSFLIAFFVLAAFWLVHHRHFHFVRAVDKGLVRINLLILAFVVLMPFTTNLSGDYAELQVAVGLFHTNMFIIGLLFLFHWRYLVGHPSITSGSISRRDADKGTYRACVLPIVSAAALVFSLISPSWSMAVYILNIPAFYILERHFIT